MMRLKTNKDQPRKDHKFDSTSLVDSADFWILSIIISIFVGSRLLWLFLNPSSTGYFEESYRWIAARELLTHPAMSFMEYQADHYQGGSLVMIMLSIIFFKLFGESIVSLKLAALLFSTGNLVLLYLIGKMFFTRLVGIISAVCYVAGPPFVASWGLVVMGSHGESVFFSLIQILLYLFILTAQRRAILGIFAFGFVSGLGIWFCYTTAISFSACIICFFLLRGIPTRKELFSISAGFILGLIPWFFYNVNYHFAGILRIFEMFGYGDPIDSWIAMGSMDKLISFLIKDFPLGMITPYPLPLPNDLTLVMITIFTTFLYLALILSMIRVLSVFIHKNRFKDHINGFSDFDEKQREMIFVVFIIEFILVYTFSSLTINRNLPPIAFRLFTPFMVISFIPMAITIVNALKRDKKWMVRISIVYFLLFFISTVTTTLASAIRTPDKNQKLSISMGYTYMGYLINRKYENDIFRTLSIADQVIQPENRHRVWTGIGWGIEHRYEKDDDLEELHYKLKDIPCPAYRYIIEGIEFFGKESIDAAIHNRIRRLDDYYKNLHDRLLKLLVYMEEQKKQLKEKISCQNG